MTSTHDTASKKPSDEPELGPEERKQRLADLVDSFKSGFLVSHTLAPSEADGHYHARPMQLLGRDDDGDLWFATSFDSPKVKEIERDPKVLVTLQDERRFVTITGHARVVRDRHKLESLWSAGMKVWFPGGKDDPSIALICVDARRAELWDASGARGLKYLFKAAKALVTGKRIESPDQKQHDELDLA